MGGDFVVTEDIVDGVYLVAPDALPKALRPRSRTMAQHLQSLVLAAATQGRANMVLWRPDEERLGALVTVRPAREPGLALVSVSSLDEPPAVLTWQMIAELLKVTRAEAEIALDLLRGETLGAIAVRRRVQHETIRTQVKNLLRKSGVPNQKQLTALLSRIAMAAPASLSYAPFGELSATR